jgi:hypothetical protein
VIRDLLLKWLTVPKADGETKQVQSVVLWEVRWQSQRGSGCGPEYPDVRPEIEVFTSEDAARKFKESLVMAFGLIRNTSCNSVEVRRNG